MFECTFVQDGVTYKGFTRYVRPVVFSTVTERLGHKLIIAWFDGEPDLWLVEGMSGLEALRAFYAAEWGPDRTTFQTFIQTL